MMEAKLEVSYRSRPFDVTCPAPRSVWNTLVLQDPSVLVTQTPDWLDCICASGGYEDASRLYEIPGRGTFVLPLVRSKHLPAFASTFYSPPYSWGMGGVIGSVPVSSEDLELIVNDLLRQPGLRTLIRPNPLVQTAWAGVRRTGVTVVPRKSHIIDLQCGFGEIWDKKFDTNTRRNVRKAEKSGVVVECDHTGKFVPVFYQLFKQSIDRWADHQHEPHWLAQFRASERDPLHKFELITKTMKTACKLWVAWYQGEPAAAIMVLQGANAHYTRGVMNKEIAGPTRANDLLHHHAIEDACRSGCRHYHMGETGQSESLARFKSRFGAIEVPYAEYHLERIPVTAIDQGLRSAVKKLIGFKDV